MGLSLVVGITATLVVPPEPGAADQVSSLKTQAAEISRDLVLEQLQIGTYQQQYDVDVAKVQRDQAEIESTENQVQVDINRVARDRKRLQSEAVSAYINLDPEVSGIEALFQNEKEAPTRTEYEEVASGDISLAIDAVRTDESGLRAERVTLEQQQVRDQATTSEEAASANSARQTATQLASKQSEITGELAVAVAQQQAAQTAAATAAVRAAQAKAASAVTASRKSSPPPASAPAVGQRTVGKPIVTPLPSMRPAGRVRWQLRRRFPGGHLHGWVPIQPSHVERSGRTGRYATAHQCSSEPSDSGRAGRPRHRPLQCRWPTALGRFLPHELTKSDTDGSSGTTEW